VVGSEASAGRTDRGKLAEHIEVHPPVLVLAPGGEGVLRAIQRLVARPKRRDQADARADQASHDGDDDGREQAANRALAPRLVDHTFEPPDRSRSDRLAVRAHRSTLEPRIQRAKCSGRRRGAAKMGGEIRCPLGRNPSASVKPSGSAKVAQLSLFRL
jgi:hypothetical protein